LITPSVSSIIDTKIKFRIVKNSNDLLIGVCDYDRVIGLGYVVDEWGNGNHGGYYMNCGGHVYSCYKK
jgi:hypothetical protein